MKKNLSIALVCLLVLMAGSYAEGNGRGLEVKKVRMEHRATQKAEKSAYKDSLSGKTREERAALRAEHRAQQKQANQEVKAKMETKKEQWKSEKAQKKQTRARIVSGNVVGQ